MNVPLCIIPPEAMARKQSDGLLFVPNLQNWGGQGIIRAFVDLRSIDEYFIKIYVYLPNSDFCHMFDACCSESVYAN